MRGNTDNLYLHVDGDSFFVACELTKHPEYKGKPVIVGADRGIAVAMSPEAKKIGITRGMPVFRIKKLFPQVIILSHHIAEGLHRILESYFQTIEVYSIDECFALVEPSEIKYFGLPRLGKAGGERKLLTELKNEIEKTLGVTYSIGLARTKALAKQASKLEKPGGLVCWGCLRSFWALTFGDTAQPERLLKHHSDHYSDRGLSPGDLRLVPGCIPKQKVVLVDRPF